MVAIIMRVVFGTGFTVLYQRLYTRYAGQLPIKTSGENRQMKQLGIFGAVTIE